MCENRHRHQNTSLPWKINKAQCTVNTIYWKIQRFIDILHTVRRLFWRTVKTLTTQSHNTVSNAHRARCVRRLNEHENAQRKLIARKVHRIKDHYSLYMLLTLGRFTITSWVSLRFGIPCCISADLLVFGPSFKLAFLTTEMLLLATAAFLHFLPLNSTIPTLPPTCHICLQQRCVSIKCETRIFFVRKIWCHS